MTNILIGFLTFLSITLLILREKDEKEAFIYETTNYKLRRIYEISKEIMIYEKFIEELDKLLDVWQTRQLKEEYKLKIAELKEDLNYYNSTK